LSGIVDVTFAPGLEPLLDDNADYRYLVLAGGRASMKSWSFARALLIRGCRRPIRWLCCRELQNSIAESVHRLFTDQIYTLGMSGYYDVQRDGIYGKNSTEFFYAGLRNDPQKVKSTEGLDGAWVEEGQSISQESWDTLDPTVRKPGSQIGISYNPRFEEDPVHLMFQDRKSTRLNSSH
jgi:phage terminase large subunit